MEKNKKKMKNQMSAGERTIYLVIIKSHGFLLCKREGPQEKVTWIPSLQT